MTLPVPPPGRHPAVRGLVAVVGVAAAWYLAEAGAEVTVVELLPQILPTEDAEIAALARRAFEQQGMRILTSAKVGALSRGADSVSATIETPQGSETVTAERAIVEFSLPRRGRYMFHPHQSRMTERGAMGFIVAV